MFLKPTICSRCKKKVATIKVTRIIEGKVTELNLCKECAAEMSPYQKKLQSNLSEILQNLISSSSAQKPKEKAQETTESKEPLPTCPHCGLNFEQYKETFFLGCSDCYTAFEEQLLPDLRRLHGSTTHVGKVPSRFRERYKKIKSLKNLKHELEYSIQNEDFEKAIQLRDKIRELQEEARES